MFTKATLVLTSVNQDHYLCSQHFPLFVCPALKVNTIFHIPAEPIEIVTEQGETVHVAPPCSWSGLAPVQVRLMSYELREGQVG